MKFKNVNGITEIILEDNDRIAITTPDNKNKINIERSSDGLDISGDASLINSIKGEGMLEKVYIPPVLAQEEILSKCDEWLEIFKKIQDKFSELVITDRYDSKRVFVKLSFENYVSLQNEDRGKTINLDLYSSGTIVTEGMHISISDSNSDIYDYIAISVLDYFIRECFDNRAIDIIRFDGKLLSEKYSEKGHGPKFAAYVSSYIDNHNDNWLVSSLITNYNMGNSSNQILANLRARIKAQVMPEGLEYGINYSRRQFNSITELENKGHGRVRRPTEQ